MTPQQQAELMAMIQQMIATNSPQPGYGAIASPMDKYGNPEPLDLDAQSKAFNVTQDWGDIYSDPAILGGLMPDTITSEMLQPNVTYEPLKGWNQVEATFRNQPNSLEGMIAGKILSGQGAFAAYNDIARILSAPGTPEYQAIAPLVPPRPPSQWATSDPLEAFDLDAVKKLADSYQSSINNEPVPVRDPETGDFIRDTNGRISTKIEEESPQAKWFRETGTPLPSDAWSTNDLASETQQKQRDESFGKTAGAEDKWRDFRSQSPTQSTLTGAEREAYINSMMKANMTTPDYPGFTNQANEALAPGSDGGVDIAGLLGGAAKLYGQGMATTVNPAYAVRRGTDALGSAASWLADLASSETRSGGMPDLNRTTADYPFAPGATATPNQPAAPQRGNPAWATSEGGTSQGPARGSRYEAELRLLADEKRRGPTGREATPQTKAAWDEITNQRRQNHKQLADEGMRKRMIAMLMAQNVTPYTSTMNSRRSQAQQSGFGF